MRTALCIAFACALAGGACTDAPATAGAGNAERGRQLVAHYHCGRCHSVPGVPAAGGRVAITLEGFGARSYIAGRVPNDDATLQRWLIAPRSVVPDTTMPAMGVSAADARDLAAYLRTLR
jgi:cytochrome c2